MMEQKTDTPAKLISIPRNAINVHILENVFAMLGENEIAAVDEVFNENIEPMEEARVNILRSATTMKSHWSRTARQFLTQRGASR